MRKRIVVWSVLLLFVVINVTSCATIFYPGRQGHTGGRLDVGMLVLDCLWFFIVPVIGGVVALVIDFGTGAIFLDGGDYSGYYVTPPGTGMDLSGGGKVKLDKIRMPANGNFRYTLPVRGDGVHTIDCRLVTTGGRLAASDTNTFLAEGSWKNIQSVLVVDAGDASSGILQVTIDGKLKAELPVEFTTAGS